MPLVRVDLRRGKPAAYRRAIADGIYEALRETFDVPDEDRFVVITQHDEDEFVFSRSYMNIARSEDLVIVQITVTNSRTVEKKQALYRTIVERLGRDPGLRPGDVFVNLVEVGRENWSFGDGVAQYVM